MPNFINESDIRSRAEALCADAPDSAKARCVRLVMQNLRADPRNARTPRAKEVAAAGAWAQRADAAGEPLSWFVASSASAALNRRFIARLRDAYVDLHSETAATHGHETVQRLECARMFANLDHMSYAAIDERTRLLARRRRRITQLRTLRAARDFVYFAADSVPATHGRTWRRICSTGELGRIGDQMENCTGFSRRTHAAYARRLINESAEFWVLETPAGAPLILLMLMTGARIVGDIRRARNGFVSMADPDVVLFMRARGPEALREPPTPPPAPRANVRALQDAGTPLTLTALRRVFSGRPVRERLQALIAGRATSG